MGLGDRGFGLVEHYLINYQGGIPPAGWGECVEDFRDSPNNCDAPKRVSGDGLATGGVIAYTTAGVRYAVVKTKYSQGI